MQEHNRLAAGRAANDVMEPNAVGVGKAMHKGPVKVVRQTGSLPEGSRRFLRGSGIDTDANAQQQDRNQALQ
jgi:hypothetical protein